MANFGIRTIQLTLGAVALAVAGMVGAQTTEAAPAMDAAKPAVKQHQKHMHKHHRHNHHRHDGKSMNREDAAARAEARRGKLDDGQSANQYERNAFARCEVFKTDIDRQACADRVKQGAVNGTVESGGILRESVIQVPVKP